MPFLMHFASTWSSTWSGEKFLCSFRSVRYVRCMFDVNLECTCCSKKRLLSWRETSIDSPFIWKQRVSIEPPLSISVCLQSVFRTIFVLLSLSSSVHDFLCRLFNSRLPLRRIFCSLHSLPTTTTTVAVVCIRLRYTKEQNGEQEHTRSGIVNLKEFCSIDLCCAPPNRLFWIAWMKAGLSTRRQPLTVRVAAFPVHEPDGMLHVIVSLVFNQKALQGHSPEITPSGSMRIL